MVEILTFKHLYGQVVCEELNASYENLQVAINQLVKSEEIISICTESEYQSVGVVSRTDTRYKVFFKFGGRHNKEKLLWAAQDRYKELRESVNFGRAKRPLPRK